ncbi:MAG TPA: Sec-independent protein translocase protein TatB [Lysobacter sp.]
MFDIGFSELLVCALVALIVLGPERLPKAARMAGLWVRRARAQWYAVRSELENELADEDMRRSILRAREEMREAQEALRADGERLRAQLADAEARMARAPGVDDPQPATPQVDDGALRAQQDDAELRMTAPSTPPSSHEPR